MGAAQKPVSALFTAGNATILGDVSVGEGSSIWFGAILRGDRDRITIGVGTNIQDNAVLHTTIGHPVRVGSSVSVGHGAILHGCTIADQVLVGMGAIVMNGAMVGEGSIIGAGAVVTEDAIIPPNSVVLGIPGKVIRQVKPEEREHILTNAREYVKLAGSYIHGW